MLVIVRLVLQDLWDFLVDEIGRLGHQLGFGSFTGSTGTRMVHVDQNLSMIPAIAPVVAPLPIGSPVTPPLLMTETKPLAITGTASTATVSPTLPPARVYYVHEKSGAILLESPYLTYDGAIHTIPYGRAVTVSQLVGNYAAVLVQGQIGYLSKDSITPHRYEVWPLFVTTKHYDASAPATLQARRIIQDVFLCGRIGLPLQASEYVLLRLEQDNIVVPWSSTINRIPGHWHTLLRGQPGVKNTVIPHSDSIIEWVAEDGIGRLGYVEHVLPDQTIQMSAIGVVAPGEYTESLVPAVVWREWRPVFISFV
jgi:hypothetical protein